MVKSQLLRAALLCLVALAVVTPFSFAAEFMKVTPRDLALQEALETRVSLDYALPTELAEIVSFLNEAISAKTNIKDALMLDQRVIATNPRPVKIVAQDITVRKALVLILSQATTEDEENNNNDLGIIPGYQHTVIYISNKARLIRLAMTQTDLRVYDVRDLFANFPMGQSGTGIGGAAGATGTGTTSGTTTSTGVVP
jgi:hypothetical protein